MQTDTAHVNIGENRKAKGKVVWYAKRNHYNTHVLGIVASKHLPPKLECEFESLLGLEFSGFGVWYCMKHIVGGLPQVLQFPPLLHW